MSAGKKGKKKKGKTLDLNSFLSENGGPTTGIVIKTSSWADDVDDEHGFSTRSNREPVILPTAPRAARGPGVNEENIPTNPPYVAYISNLPYDVDDDDLVEFFGNMKVSNMRLPRDSNKLRGYGYVEFEDRQSLIDALSISNTTIKNRPIRIDVSNSSNDDRRGGRMGRDNRRDGYDDPERTSGDWRSGTREDTSAMDNDRYRSRFDNRDHESSEYDNKPGAWRNRDPVSDRDTGADRGRSAMKFSSNDEGRDRGEREWRYGGDRGGDRGDRGGSRDRGSTFGPRRNFGGDSDWSRDGPSRSFKPGPVDSKPSEPRTRPKLNLQPRTKPVETVVTKDESANEEREISATEVAATALAPQPPVPAVNIFGEAKPVDTTAREREIEERLAKSKEEEEEKRTSRETGTWGRRNGEGRDERDKDRDRDRDRDRGMQTWRSSEEDKDRRSERHPPARSDQRGDSRGPPQSRLGVSKAPHKPSESRGPHRERRDREKDEEAEISRMPKAKDDQAPNFVASNKYSMLPDDVDPDNIDD
ncbi:eukaryotic translation initiation factor 4B-like isoform X2 [Prorops nasuta]|uniref:eukaryotic translation initiation factor 4B-like isoform X2 n=1 Tax=Prorops nasuta TaxID=863751 RepID=UPI0034CD75A6